MKLKFHKKPVNDYTEISDYLLIPKKLHAEFNEGDIELVINGRRVKTRIYDIFCDCQGEKHIHKIIDLRDHYQKIGLEDGEEAEVGL